MKAKDFTTFPEEKLVYDWYWNTTTKEWQTWFDTISEYEVDIRASFNEIVVPTQDSIRMKYIFKTLVTNNKKILMPGPTGTGKTVYVSELVTYQMPEEYQCIQMTFSAQTSANQVQDTLDDKVEKRRKGVFGPPIGKKYIIFVDDLNMPQKEEYGAQPPLELIRQFMDHNGWYDRKSKEKPFWKLEDLIMTGAMGPPGGGRSIITARLQRHYNLVTYTDLQFDAITVIYTTILNAFFHAHASDIKSAIDPLIEG